ncbi:unnamed protein product [Mytilus coruscus]|uniref:Uncharacterized protein n=1 Tax=Mytilus coruscus TaxID=42192 RepID=A0A6J8EMY8_MYTCO|nr:unnamed protein product [Mytilus coruscus]
MNNGSYFKRSKKESHTCLTLGKITVKDKVNDFFFPSNGGVRAAPVKRSEEDSKGIFKVKTGYQVKLKLSLMNGNIGFGWIRKNFIHGAKKWGFYYLTHMDATKEIGEPLLAQKDDYVADFADFENFVHDENTQKEADADIATSMQKLLSKCINESENLIVF